MNLKIILLNRLLGAKRGDPIPPGVYTGTIQNVVHDALTDKVVMQIKVENKPRS